MKKLLNKLGARKGDDQPSRREQAEEERKKKKAERDEVRHAKLAAQGSLRRGTNSSFGSQSPTQQSVDYSRQHGSLTGAPHADASEPASPSGMMQAQQSPLTDQQGGGAIRAFKTSNFFSKIKTAFKSPRSTASPGTTPSPGQPTQGQGRTPSDTSRTSSFRGQAGAVGPAPQQHASILAAQPQQPPRAAAAAAPPPQGFAPTGPAPWQGAAMAQAQAQAQMQAQIQAQAQNHASQVRDMQMQISVLQSQVQQVDELKRQLALEQRAGNDWKEKWNYQNFKLNLAVDMLVLRSLELDAGVAAAAPAARAVVTTGSQGGGGGAWGGGAGLSSVPEARRAAVSKAAAEEIIEDSIEDW